MTATLPTRKKHDEIKRNYAEKNYIELLEIWYFNFDNIDKILSEKLILKCINTITKEKKHGKYNSDIN